MLQLLQYLLLCYLLHRHPHSPLCSPQESNPDHDYLSHNSLDLASLQHLQPGRAERPHCKHARPSTLRQCLVPCAAVVPCALCCRRGILPLGRTRSSFRVFVLLPCVQAPGLLHIEGMALECGRLRHVCRNAVGCDMCGGYLLQGGLRFVAHMAAHGSACTCQWSSMPPNMMQPPSALHSFIYTFPSAIKQNKTLVSQALLCNMNAFGQEQDTSSSPLVVPTHV